MANRTKLTPEKRERFLAVIAETANITRAAAEIGLARRYMYEIRARDEPFKSEWDKAVEIGVASLEDEATRRAVEGWEEPVWYQGEHCGTVRKFSDNLLMFRLKAQWPDKYRERLSTELSTKDGDALNIRVSFVGE